MYFTTFNMTQIIKYLLTALQLLAFDNGSNNAEIKKRTQ